MERALVRRSIVAAVMLGLVMASAACQASAPTPSSLDVWAVVNGTEVRREHVERLYRTMLDPSAETPTDEEVVNAKLSILEDLIHTELLIARAPALQIAPTDDEVAEAVVLQRGGLSEEDFTAQLTERDITLDQFRQEVRRTLIARKVVEKEVNDKVIVGDDQVTAFFEKNKAQFNFTERQYHLAQIVVDGQPTQVSNRRNDDATTAAEAQRKATMITERLRTGDGFADLAADFSEDPQSAPQGGDIGWVPQSRIDQAPAQLRQAVMKMAIGEVNTLTSGATHTILALVAIQEPGQRELSDPEVKDAIRTGLKDRRVQLLENAYMARMRAESTIVNFLARQVIEAQGNLPAAGQKQ